MPQKGGGMETDMRLENIRIENLKQEFPVMPDEIRAMVEQEVTRQLNTTAAGTPKRKGRIRKLLIAALAAAMALGTTVFAGTVYRMGSEQNGAFGAEVKAEKISGGQSEETVPAETGTDIRPVKMEVSYLPEGLRETERSGKFGYEDAPYDGGVTVSLYEMDMGDDLFEMSFEEVVSREDMKINGYDGVYLQFSNLLGEENAYDQRIYVAYPDIHYVMEMFVSSNVSKEDAVKMAESIRFTPVSEGDDCISGYKWSEYLASKEEREEIMEYDFISQVEKSALGNAHAVGESFSVEATISWEGYEGLTAKVSDVQVFDNISVLDLSKDADIKKELAEETDAQGNLLPGTIQYIKNGNSTDSLTEIVDTKEISQKLVYITLEYTNNGDAAMQDILYMCGLMKLVEKDGKVEIYEGETPGESDNWDIARISGAAGFLEMYYTDVFGREGKNYIDSLRPGETAVVHLAWVVPERELEYLYLNLNGNPYEFTEEDLAIGYVDIRQ